MERMDELSMLQELSIKNFALIDNVQVDFKRGLNVLTGETGAGKSILLDSIGILCGNRASGEFIRLGEDKAEVDGTFQLDEEVAQRIRGLDAFNFEENTLYLSREISRTGSNKCRINFKTVSLSLYQQVGSLLFDIHGQNQEQSILSRDKQLELLDKYLSLEEPNKALIREVKDRYSQYNAVKMKLRNLLSGEQEKEDMIAYYEFAIREIDAAELKIGEDQALKEERSRILNSEKLSKKGELVYTLLNNNGILSDLDTVLFTLREMNKIDDSQEKDVALLENAYYELEGFNHSFKSYFSSLEFDEKRMNEIEGRLEELNRLKRKYGNSIEGILGKKEEMAEKIMSAENKDQRIAEYQLRMETTFSDYKEIAEKLTKLRIQGAASIEKAIKDRLSALNIYKDGFEIQFLPLEEPSAVGMEGVEFLFSPNKGEGVKPLRKIASGGEISRVMLAFKGIFAEIDYIPTLIFDEIDSGIGGETLTKVALALSHISVKRQIICVTHSAILAAFADEVLSVRKRQKEDRTVVEITSLTKQEDRIDELSRMLGGQENFLTAREQSREMIMFALKEKKV